MVWLGTVLAGFCLVAILAVVGYTLKTGISPMPSSAAARRETLRFIAEYSEPDRQKTIVDCGSGWGNLAIALARRFPQHQVVGYELSPVPWLASVLLKHLLRLDNLTLYRRDLFKADFSQVDIVTCFLFPQGMALLERKIQEEGSSIELVISNFFAFPSRQADKIVRLRDWHASPIYLYRL